MAQQSIQAPPPAKGMTPQQYYMALISQGMRSQDAYAALQQAYGPPKSPQQLQQEQQSAASNAALAQTGGTLAGLAGSAYLYGQLGGAGAAAAGAGTGAGTGGAVLGSVLGGGAGAGGSMATAGGGAVMGSGAVGTGATAAGATGGVATGGGAAGGAAAGAGAGAVLVPAAIVAGAAVLASNAWETGMKDIVRGRGTREDYINQVANHMTGLNLGLRLFGKRSIGSMMTSGKSQQQQIRDSFRTNLKDSGVADDKYQVTLADGSKFDIGLDGKHKFTNVDGKTQRNPYDVDFTNPLAKYATDKIDPMIRRIYADAPEGMHVEQFTGMLVNAAASNAKNEKEVDANIAAMLGQSPFAKQAGIDTKNVQALNKLERPKQGEVLRLSPGLYRTDTGKIQQAKTMRQALELAYAANPQQPIAQPQSPEEIPEL